jgi:RHS repeat-associated protein
MDEPYRAVRDNLGRTLSTVEDFGGSPLKNKTTLFDYTPAGMVSLTAAQPSAVDQETEWSYGVSTTGGSSLNSNDIVRSTWHPDPSTGESSPDEEDTVTVDRMGRTKTSADRNGNVHTYTFDARGQLISDEVTQLGAGVDGAVRKIAYNYDTLGNLQRVTSYNAANEIVNEVVREFNGFGQLIREYQAVVGEVESGTPYVQYDFSEAAGGNHSRLAKITYPSGYELDYNYVTGVGSNVSRLTSISDSTGTLEELVYQGNRIVGRNRPSSDMLMTLDAFGRVGEISWHNDDDQRVSGYAYVHDKAGNRLAREDLVHSSYSERYVYDRLNQLTQYERGYMVDESEFDPVAAWQTWTHDSLGNWNTLNTNGVTQTRESNAQNEYTQIGSATLEHDANGNLTIDDAGQHLKWDAWNRLVAVSDATGLYPLREYAYDGLNRRVFDSDTTHANDLYYSSNWQVLEERRREVGDAPSDAQFAARYVWSPVYVDALVLRDTPDGRLWVIQDANYNVVALMDNDGDVVERYSYTPFGVPTIMDEDYITIGTSNFDWKHHHQGLEHNTTTGTTNNRNRVYLPSLGQFASNDPLHFGAGDVNVRRYVGNGPVNGLDPWGLDSHNEGGVIKNMHLPQPPGSNFGSYGGIVDLIQNPPPLRGHYLDALVAMANQENGRKEAAWRSTLTYTGYELFRKLSDAVRFGRWAAETDMGRKKFYKPNWWSDFCKEADAEMERGGSGVDVAKQTFRREAGLAVMWWAGGKILGVGASTSPKNGAKLPGDAQKALTEIEQGAARPNVRKPKSFANDGRGGTPRLPSQDAAGKPITYTEHTVNPRPPGGTLDGKRIVNGSDGSVWYTDDHFATWTRVK